MGFMGFVLWKSHLLLLPTLWWRRVIWNSVSEMLQWICTTRENFRTVIFYDVHCGLRQYFNTLEEKQFIESFTIAGLLKWKNRILMLHHNQVRVSNVKVETLESWAIYQARPRVNCLLKQDRPSKYVHYSDVASTEQGTPSGLGTETCLGILQV